jgi:N-acyl-D-aspartate/D-glutamate deacylase
MKSLRRFLPHSQSYSIHNATIVDGTGATRYGGSVSVLDGLIVDVGATSAANKGEHFDVDELVDHPMAMIGSDGFPGDLRPHPRGWGTFTRVLKRYVNERASLTLEEAVRRMTSLPAQTFGLHRRGCLKKASHADLVVFDPTSVADVATYSTPCKASLGIVMVAVNGAVVYHNDAPTGARPGELLQSIVTSPSRHAIL